MPVNCLRTEILVRMKQLFLSKTPDTTTVLVLHGMVRQENDVCVVAERTSGVTLHDLLPRRPLNVRSSLQILLDVADGMRYLHSRNIIHRMLTTSCIYLTSEGSAKVGTKEYSRAYANVMTNIGIPYHAAPEILTGATSYTEKVDVYSFAMLIVEVVTKKEPYANVDAPEATILEHVVQKHYRPVFDRTAEWPADLFDLMEECWSADPEKRPTFDTIVARLKNLDLVERLLNDY
ncbi:TKL protein kinase [Saprolegnia parasitica CBS 223.65]|uniref:TKL protein kinase n=1 Tax=Saprolegnia parasitica (strain CBS 223.65) TaxID=695850 RepID=A0A067CNJ2_SAPPC|nr:TKL protein kinase [Saprolegnia parasitica CBS 223.65]KDO28106.1 TKL protein kinase [Saprolegnia parasitica CBS 223.65]|eukprot:XP_012201247.1 TKL protein kinase [Saprolegnia parasitica CBS 223.65]